MVYEHIAIWINATATVLILLSALKLYEINHGSLGLCARIFLAAVSFTAIYSTFEILAWRRPLPLGMTIFIVVMAIVWAMRAFTPLLAFKAVPAGVGVTGASTVAQAQAQDQKTRQGNSSFAVRGRQEPERRTASYR